MNSVTSARALLLGEEEALAGATTISLETQQDLQEDDVFTYIQENFVSFIRMLRYLSPEDQDMLLSYYLLGKTQTTLASIFRSTQTVCSFRIRMAVRVIGAFLLFGEPTQEVLARVLGRAGMEDSLKGGLSRAVIEYARCRSFQEVADVLGLHRPDVRRAMSRAARSLMGSKDSREAALAAWIHSLVDKSNPVGPGYSKRKMQKEGHLYRRDPDVLGEFSVRIEDPAFDALFVSRANR
jgi:DNA-directed RNA polymerase specialized sigma24 family protein